MGDGELTRGQELVRYRFNPSGKSEVDAVKLKVADLIDLLDAMQGSEVDGREVNIAITHLQTASMFAVAALTKGK